MPDKLNGLPDSSQYGAATYQKLKDVGDGSFAQIVTFPNGFRDVTGRLKTSKHQNMYDADFEYGPQPLRWENYLSGGASITHLPGEGGVRMRLTTAAGDISIRQSRPYHRYQPGKTMFMATAMNLGFANAGQVQRIGFFDDGNGIFFEQSTPVPGTNPFGMFVVVRSDAGGIPVDNRIPLNQWNSGNDNAFLTKPSAAVLALDWTRMQMIFCEYAWYGAGALRWGVMINGEPIILHQFGIGNLAGQIRPWARTGNLPVRYEQRNITSQASPNDMIHYGVSVLIEGGIDPQRGFTYGYGMSAAAPRRAIAASTLRFPLLSFRYRAMGTQEYTQASSAVTAGTTTSVTATGTPWIVDQWKGRYVFFPGLGASGAGAIARITTNTTSTLTFVDNVKGGPIAVAPAAAQAYTIGIINRGQLLPMMLHLSTDQPVTLELISSTTGSPVVLTAASFQTLASLGSNQSFAERDVSATALTGGEVVYNAPVNAGAPPPFDLSNFFPLYNNVQGNQPDLLTVAITTGAAISNVGCSIIVQEAMS